MSDDSDMVFKIGIVGPTRVGKTSLIASILHDAGQLLAGTPVSMRPDGSNTNRRLSQHNKELSGSIRAGEFNPGSVSGTEESFKYELILDPGTTSGSIKLCLLDYPGGWIDPNRRPEERDKDWNTCKQWMENSSVLIVPVESAVMMEASSSRHRKAVPFILNTYDVEQVARAWAKHRATKEKEPALLIFCPVKCESYFSDNGGLTDSSDQLFHAFEDNYSDVLKAVKDEAPGVTIVYAPVDTVGCVEIIKSNWRDETAAEGGIVFSADYRVRRPGRQAVKGADAVLISICQHIVKAQSRIETSKADKKEQDAEHAITESEKDEGLLVNLWRYLTREKQQLEERAKDLTTEAERQRQAAKGLVSIISRLAEHRFDRRVRIL